MNKGGSACADKPELLVGASSFVFARPACQVLGPNGQRRGGRQQCQVLRQARAGGRAPGRAPAMPSPAPARAGGRAPRRAPAMPSPAPARAGGRAPRRVAAMPRPAAARAGRSGAASGGGNAASCAGVGRAVAPGSLVRVDRGLALRPAPEQQHHRRNQHH
jgi:hypothetical protein